MAAFLERLGIFARSPDARPLAEIAADIDAELEFHVEESARALEQAGLAPELARAEALKRFGDYGRIRRECARTCMGERIMLQRIQLVLTAVLVLAVGALLWSNRQSDVAARAALDAERQRTAALLARVEERLSIPRLVSDVALLPPTPSDPVKPVAPGNYLGSDGREMDFDSAAESWEQAFYEQNTAWRHGLKIAERLSALPGAQGAEILARIWPSLSVVHREQAMKPFVFDGGHPNALEVLQLGFEDDQTSVKERAVLYLHTYAWKNLWSVEATSSAWFAEFRDRPVAEVLRENARRWAGEVRTLRRTYESAFDRQDMFDLLVVVDQIRPETFAKAGVDLPGILREAGLAEISDADVAGISDTAGRARVEKIRAWARVK